MRKPLEDHKYHTLTDDELRHIIKDAGDAAIAMQGHSYESECKYLDQVNDANTIISYRNTLGKVQSVCLETVCGATIRLSYQIKVF